MKKTEPVTISLLKTILRHYPTLTSYQVMTCDRADCISGSQRLRELSSKGLIRYDYGEHKYYFIMNDKDDIRLSLKAEKQARGLR